MTVRTLLGRAATGQVLILAAPFVFYLVPFLAGYGWTANSPKTPRFAGMATPPGRQSVIPTAIEHYGTGVVVVPFQARLRAYLRDGDLPLWNPYSGLGQPFAAQGEGSPYFPMAVVRSLLPTSWSNAVTFVTIGISAVCLFGFLRLLGLSRGTAAFGGAVWSISGQFTLNVARNNYIDQAAMIPPLFLAAAWALSSRRVVAYVVLALVVGLHAIAGLLQMGANSLLLLGSFIIFSIWLRGGSLGERFRALVVTFIFVGLGTVLAAPYVLPIVEAIGVAYNKNIPYLAFYPMPTANVVAFFFPLLFGQVFQSWMPGEYPNIVDWNNLYAHGSTGLLLLTILALAALPRDRRDQRLTYVFFLGGLIFFLTRFLSLPPASLVSFLPILSQQSPKHSLWPAVFCLVIAAAFGVEWLRQIDSRRARWLVGLGAVVLVNVVITLMGRRGGVAGIDGAMALTHLGVTLTIGLILLGAFSLAQRARTDAQAALIATAAVVGECSIYLLLGNDDWLILVARVGIAVLVTLTGVLMARGWLVPSAIAALAVVGFYAWVVIWPESGLPKRVDVDSPPPYMVWLQKAVGHEYRTFGIWPDYSSVGEIQDAEVVGPVATNEWVSFVDLIASAQVAAIHRFGSTFALPLLYDLTLEYPRARPLLDWAGVRYIVLDKVVFAAPTRRDHLALWDPLFFTPMPGLRLVYDDEAVTIFESTTAQSKAYFTTRVRQASVATTLAALQADPASIDDTVSVEVDLGGLVPGDGSGPSMPVPVPEYHPNNLRATFEAPGPGVFVVKDSYFPGWQATLNGQPTEIIRVNGMVRGVIVPAAGHYEVTMSYRPAAFYYGAIVSGGALLVLLAVLAWKPVYRRYHGSGRAIRSGEAAPAAP